MSVEQSLEFHWLKEDQVTKYMPVMLDLIKKNRRHGTLGSDEKPASSTQLLNILTDKKHTVSLVEMDDELIGFTIYTKLDSDNKSMRIKKMVIDLEHDNLEIRQQIVDNMDSRLREGCAHSLYYTVHIDDAGMQKVLTDSGYGPPVDKAAAIKKEHFPNGDAAVRYEKHLPCIGKGVLTLYEPQECEEPKTQRDILMQMMEKLELMTGVKWEAVMKNGGDPKAEEITHMNADKPDLMLRTVEPVEGARAAYKALCGFMGQRPVQAVVAKLSKKAHVEIQASDVRAAHIRSAREGRLTPVFSGDLPRKTTRGNAADGEQEFLR